jgi:hypothetical protein
MKRYGDYKKIEDITWAKYVIIVPTEEDKKELEEAFEHIHYSDIDTDNIAVNQLAHEYLTPEITGDERSINNIVVDLEAYEKLKVKR